MNGKDLFNKFFLTAQLCILLLFTIILMTLGTPTSPGQAQAGFPSSGRCFLLDDRLAVADDLKWQIEVVDPAISAGGSVSLKLDSNDQPHLSYVDVNTNELKYAYRQQGGSWHLETVFSDVYNGGTSLALDSQGKPLIAFIPPPDNALILARFDGSKWITDTVHQGLYVWYPSLALDSQQRPHLSYALGGVVWYAYRQQDGWVKRVVENVGLQNTSNSLALDQTDTARISYYFYHSRVLKYARWVDTDWDRRTVDYLGNMGFFNSLALDAQDYPHISYYDWTDDDLEYAYQDAQGWHLETVESEGDVGSYNSIAVDPLGRPHIGYWKDTEQGLELKYAVKEAGKWQFHTIESNLSTFPVAHPMLSLALDSQNRPHLGYPGRSLKHAWLGEEMTGFFLYLPLILRSP